MNDDGSNLCIKEGNLFSLLMQLTRFIKMWCRLSHLHILHHEVRSAKVYESEERVLVLELQVT